MGRSGAVDQEGAGLVDRRPRWRRSPAVGLAVIGAVIVVFLVGGLVLRRHEGDEYQQTMTRVQLEAQAAGEAIEPATYLAAWVAQGGYVPPGDDTVTPHLAGAQVDSTFVAAQPPTFDVAYLVEQGGRSGCVRLSRTESGTTVTTHDGPCTAADEGPD